MKLILSSLAIAFSMSALAQMPPTPVTVGFTKDQKLAAFKQMGSFIPYKTFKGHIVGVAKVPWKVHRCTGSAGSASPEWFSSALYENKAFPLEGFSDGYHPNPVGITYMTVNDSIIDMQMSDSKASITSLDLKDNTTATLTIEKLPKNHVVLTVTRGTMDANQKITETSSRGCEVDLDDEYKE